MGPEGAREKVEGSTPFTRPLEDLVTVYCFGETWGREQELSHDIRSMLTIGMLIALGRFARDPRATCRARWPTA